MGGKKSSIIPVFILTLFLWKVNSLTYSETWGVTQFEELKLKYTWMIHNFKLVTLQNQSDSFYSPGFWPPENEKFRWYLSLTPESSSDSSYMGVYLAHNHSDSVYVNYTVSIGSVKIGRSYTFRNIIGLGDFIQRDEVFKSCLPNGTLIINCEIRAISNIVESSGTNGDNYTSLKKQTLKGKLPDELLSLLEDEKFSDVTIIIEDSEIQAHKLILAARSPVFASLLMENDTLTNSENSSSIEVTDIKPKVFRKLLQYIYTDKVDGVDSNMARDLLVAAVKYDIKGLKETCEEILYNSISVNDAIEILDMADQYNVTELKSKATKFVVKNASNVVQSTGFKKLERSKQSPMFQAFRNLVEEYRSAIPSP